MRFSPSQRLRRNGKLKHMPSLPADYKPNWFAVSFDADYQRIYQHTDDTALKDVNGVLRYLDLPKSGIRPQHTSLLDLGCGWGRHSIPLAKFGYRVTGLDLSETMLQAASQRAADAHLAVTLTDITELDAKIEPQPVGKSSLRLVRGDMRKKLFVGEFDVVLNLFTSFGYFSDPEDNLKVLESTWAALKPGGRFIIDVNNPQRYVAEEVGISNIGIADAEGEAHSVERQERYDRKRNRRVVTYRFLDQDRDPIYLECELYDRDDMQYMLEGQGFIVSEDTWGDFGGMRYNEDVSPRLIMLATKPGGHVGSV